MMNGSMEKGTASLTFNPRANEIVWATPGTIAFISDPQNPPPPGSDPRVQPLKIGGWHVILFIRHLGAMLSFKRGLIITTL